MQGFFFCVNSRKDNSITKPVVLLLQINPKLCVVTDYNTITQSAIDKAASIRTYRFVRQDEGWFLYLPEYVEQGGNKAALQMLEGADEILSIIARGKKHVSIYMDTTPFEDADLLELDELCDAPKGGGYYIMRSLRGKPYSRRMWLCDIVLFVFGDMPPQIFVRKQQPII